MTISATVSLNDKMSPALSRAEKQAIANIKQYENLDKQLRELDKTEQKLWDTGLQGTEIYKQLEAAQASIVTQMQELEDGTRNAVLEEEKMANVNGEVASSALDLNQSLELLQKAWSMLSKVMQEANQWMEASNQEFNARFTSMGSMHTMMGATEEEIQSMYDYADALQKVGIIGNEAILSGAATMASGATSIETLKQLSEAAANATVKAYGINATQSNYESTANSMRRALEGNAASLYRNNIITKQQYEYLDKINDKYKRESELIRIINANAGKMNETIAQTPEGKIIQVNNSMKDLEEELGQKLIPFMAQFKQTLLELVTPIVDWAVANSDWLIPTLITLAAVIGVLIAAMVIYNAVMALAALAEAGVLWPLLLIIAAMLLIIGLIVLIVNKVNEATGSNIDAFGAVVAVFLKGIADIYNAFAIWWNAVALFANFLANVFIDPVASIKILFIDLGMVLSGIFEDIARQIDALFGTNLANTISMAIGYWQKQKDKIKSESDYKEVMGQMEYWNAQDAIMTGYNFGANISKGISDGLDNNDLFKSLTDAIVPGDNGVPALNTKNSDNSLFSEEDIQLLLDAATREYKLNYTQLTPNVTMTFGDIHETADVDNIYEHIVEQLEEMYDSDLEVAPA